MYATGIDWGGMEAVLTPNVHRPASPLPVAICLFLDLRWVKTLETAGHDRLFSLLLSLSNGAIQLSPRFLIQITSETPLLEFVFQLSLPITEAGQFRAHVMNDIGRLTSRCVASSSPPPALEP